MLASTVRIATLWLLGLWLVACTRVASTPVPNVSSTPVPLEVPVTVEVTRVVTQSVLIEVTPVPRGPCSPASLEATSAITIGAILPLSLPGAMTAGFAMQSALALAVEEINAKGGIAGLPVSLITYDSAGQAERGRAAVEHLILEDCAAGIVGFYHSSVALAAADVAHVYGTPLIVAEAYDDEITTLAYPEVFRISATRSMLADMPAAWLAEVGDYNQDGRISAGVIVDSAKPADHVEAVIQAFADHSIQAYPITVDLPASDFSSAVARIVTMEQVPDAIFIYLKGENALALASQILAAGIGPQKSTLLILQHAGLNSDEFWEKVPKGAGTVVARLGPWLPTVTTTGQQFALTYGQYMNGWPPTYAFASYDAFYLMADAIKRSGSAQGPALISALQAGEIRLASGHYSFPYGSLNAPSAAGVPSWMWQQWPDVQTLYLQYTLEQQPADEIPVIWPRIYRTVDTPLVR